MSELLADDGAFERDGFVVVRNVVAPADCDALIEAAHRLSEDGGIFAPLMMPHRRSALFLEALRRPSIVDRVASLIGGEVSGLQSQFFFSKPGTNGFSAHQDNFFVEAPSDAFVSVWAALTDVRPENGSLIVWPGSHRLGRLPVRDTAIEHSEGQDPNANNEEVVLPPGCASIDLPLDKGDAVFLHAELAHASNPNRSGVFRYAVLNTYVRRGESFRPGRTARRDEVVLRA